MTQEFSILEHQIAQRERLLNEQAAYGQGQGSLPHDWDATRAERIKKSSKPTVDSFFYFCKAYFPKWFEYDFCNEHRRLIAAALKNDRKLRVFAGPRGFGKTRLFRVFKVWCGCFGIKKHYSKSSDSLDLVEKDFRHTRNIFKYNPKIVSDFGNVIDENWDSTHSFRVKPHRYNPDGTFYVANSFTVTPRGELADIRIDFQEKDEWEDYATSINPDTSKAKLDVIERDYLPALTDTGCAVYLGNNARTTCLINILAEMKDEERAAQHPAVELHIIDEWDEQHSRPTWYQRYTYKTEDEMRVALGLSISVWKAEHRQQPSPPEGTRFLLEHWSTFNVLHKDDVGIMFCDPAFGETSDYKTFVIMLYSPTARKFKAPECFVRRCGWEEYFLAMYDSYNRFRSHLYWIGWESNFAQAQYLEFRKIYVTTKSKPELPIRKIAVEGDKFFRIEQLETPFSLRTILFSENFLGTRDGVEAQSQLIGYVGKKDSKHRVDFPDALASAYKEVWQIAMRLELGGSSGIEVGGKRRSARY